MSLKDTFQLYASVNNHSEATATDMTNWCSAAGLLGVGGSVSAIAIGVVFDKVKVSPSGNLTFEEMEAFIVETAILYKEDKKTELFQAVLEIKQRLSAQTLGAVAETSKRTAAVPAKRTAAVPVVGSSKKIKISKKVAIMKDVPGSVSVVDLATYVSGYGRVIAISFDEEKHEVEVEFSTSTEAEQYVADNPNGFYVDEDLVSLLLYEKPVSADGSESEDDSKLDTLVLSNYRWQKVTIGGMYNLFCLYGTVIKIQLLQSQDVCYVKFVDSEHAARAKQALECVSIWGLQLKVDAASDPSAHIDKSDLETKDFEPINARPLCVPPTNVLVAEGFPETMDEVNAVKLFNVRATVTKFRFMGLKDGARAARVELLSISEAVEAVMVLNGRAFAKSDKTLSVSFAAEF